MRELQKQLEELLKGNVDSNLDNLCREDYSALQNVLFLASEIKRRSINI